MAKITTPVEGFNGTVAGVTFVDGVGETVDEGAVAYFERQGYGVDVEAPEESDPAATDPEGEAPEEPLEPEPKPSRRTK